MESSSADLPSHIQPEPLPPKDKLTPMQKLYEWTLSLAGSKGAEYWLAFIAFVESSVFLIPADVLYVPMAVSKPERAYRYAAIATIASVLGGIAGWMLGYFAFEAVAKPVLEFYGKLEAFEAMRASVSDGMIALLLVTSGLSHLPPIKIVTILSGAAGINIWFFIVSALIARGARFFALAWLLKRYGEAISHFIENRLSTILMISAAVVIAGFVAYKLLHG
jgi:membrane protein YqaA with SNARE-associated domain